VRVITLVAAIDQGLELGNIFRVRKVDDINCDVVLSETLAKFLVLILLLLEWVATEDDDARLLVLVHSVLQ